MTKNRQAKKDARAHKEQSGQSYAASRRQGLVPKQITRKDGVLTTVWVRPEDAGMVGSSARAKVGALPVPSSSAPVPIPASTPLTYVQGVGVENVEPLDDDVSTCTFNGLPALTAKVDGDLAILVIHGVDKTQTRGRLRDAGIYWTALPEEGEENWTYNELLNSGMFTGDMGLYPIHRDRDDEAGPVGAYIGATYVAPGEIAGYRAEYLIDPSTDKVAWYDEDGEMVPEGTEDAERDERLNSGFYNEDGTYAGWRSLDKVLKSEGAQEWIEERLDVPSESEVPQGAVLPKTEGPIKYAQVAEDGRAKYTIVLPRRRRATEDDYMDEVIKMFDRDGAGFQSIEETDDGDMRLVMSDSVDSEEDAIVTMSQAQMRYSRSH